MEELNRCSDGIVQCGGCSYAGKTWDWGCEAALMADAADAIENLERKVENLEQENRFLKSMQRGIAENMELDSLGKMVARAMREVRYE